MKEAQQASDTQAASGEPQPLQAGASLVRPLAQASEPLWEIATAAFGRLHFKSSSVPTLERAVEMYARHFGLSLMHEDNPETGKRVLFAAQQDRSGTVTKHPLRIIAPGGERVQPVVDVPVQPAAPTEPHAGDGEASEGVAEEDSDTNSHFTPPRSG